MAEAVDLLVTQAAFRGIVLAAGILGLNMLSPQAGAEEPEPAPTHPIWTLVPTHIDRDKEKHIRIEPEADAQDHIIISVDHPIRVSPEGTFSVDGKATQIFGIVLPDRQLLCETPGGMRWACGVRAQAAFVFLLARRALTCERVSPLGTTVMVASCKAGDDDIAERLIGDGWAEADARAGVKLKSIEAAARKAHRGRWSETVPGY